MPVSICFKRAKCEVVRTTVKFQKKSKIKIKLKQSKQQNKTKQKQTNKQNKTKTNKQTKQNKNKQANKTKQKQTNKQKREKHEVEVRLSLNRSPVLSIHYFHKQDFSFYDMTANRLHVFFYHRNKSK